LVLIQEIFVNFFGTQLCSLHKDNRQ